MEQWENLGEQFAKVVEKVWRKQLKSPYSFFIRCYPPDMTLVLKNGVGCHDSERPWLLSVR
jgi:hypothetical protein